MTEWKIVKHENGGHSMKERKRGYWLLFAITILLALAAISTIIPSTSASKECILGYKAHCAFTPLSTLICVVAAAIVCIVRKKAFIVKRED